MKEIEYIKLTNLTKLKMCETILRDTSFEENGADWNFRADIIIKLQLMQDEIKIRVV